MSSLPEQYQAVCKTANQLDQRTVNSTVHKMTSDLMAAKANLEQKQRSLEGKLSDKEALKEDLDRCLKELKGWSQDVKEPVIFVLEVEPVKEALCLHQVRNLSFTLKEPIRCRNNENTIKIMNMGNLFYVWGIHHVLIPFQSFILPKKHNINDINR